MDWPGFVTFTVFISSLLLSLTFAAYGSVDYRVTAGLAVLAVLSLWAFVRFEHRTKFPLLDLSLLRIREFTGGSVAQMINAIAWGAFLLVISLYLQLVKGLSPLEAGIAILPFDAGFLVAGPLSGHFSDKYGTLPFTTSGLAVISLALYLFAGASVGTSYSYVLVLLVVGGLGNGLFASPNISSIMGSVPPERRGVASALRGTLFNVGYTISLNAVILLMTISVPYALITNVISSLNPAALSVADRASFASGLHLVYLVLAAVNTVAIVPSILRGKHVDAGPPSDSSNTAPPLSLEGD